MRSRDDRAPGTVAALMLTALAGSFVLWRSNHYGQEYPHYWDGLGFRPSFADSVDQWHAILTVVIVLVTVFTGLITLSVLSRKPDLAAPSTRHTTKRSIVCLLATWVLLLAVASWWHPHAEEPTSCACVSYHPSIAWFMP